MRELISCIRNLPKHLKTAFVNVWRNGVMSFSSIFAVTITLLLIGVIALIAFNVQNITDNIKSGVSIYVQLDRDIDQAQEEAVGEAIQSVNGVDEITYSSKEDELNKLIERQGEDGRKLFESYRGENNPLGSAYEVTVQDASTIEKVAEQIEVIDNVNNTNYGGSSTQSMIQTLDTVQKGGTIFVVGLVIIAIFMISNTIKITITARQTEISIMRMVGASNWYIRIPFMLEGMLIGLIGAVIPIIALVYGYGIAYDYLGGNIVSSMLTLMAPMPFIRDFSFVLAGLGAIVGIVGSAISMRRFLRF